METPLLTYLFATDPVPLMVSTPTAPQQGRINAGVLSRGQQVYCDLIRIAVPVGTAAGDAYTQTPASSVNTPRWIDQSVQTESGADIGGDPALTYAVFTYVPRDHTDDRIDYSLVLGLLGTVSEITGTFGYLVHERSGTTPNRSEYVARQATYDLAKSTVQLYLRNFAAATVAQPTVPATQVAAGTPLQLDWSSTGAWFELYAGGQSGPVFQGQATSVRLDHGIARDTTFFLLASATGNTDDDDGQGGYQTIYAYATLSLAVTNPTIPELTVAGPLQVTGAATLAGAAEFTGAATFRKDVTAEGTVTAKRLSAPDLSVERVSAQSVSAPVVSAGALQNASGGSPLIRDDNGHTWLIKWVGQQGSELVAQLFMWDDQQRWGGLRLPVLGYKTFVIDHPLDSGKYLVHATLEGPEAAVFYRGTSQLAGGRSEICLPDYADELTDPDSWTVQLTNISGFDRLAIERVDGRCVHKGRFVVAAEDPGSTQEFGWEAKGTRRDQGPLDAEPARHGIDVHAIGPYTFAVPRNQHPQ